MSGISFARTIRIFKKVPGVLVSYRNPFVQLLNLNFVPSETGESSPATQASLNEEGEYEERNCICIEHIASCHYSFCITFFITFWADDFRHFFRLKPLLDLGD